MIPGQVTPRGARRVGAAFLLGAAALTLSLADVRARTTLPNVVWFLGLVVLLAVAWVRRVGASRRKSPPQKRAPEGAFTGGTSRLRGTARREKGWWR